MSLSSSSSSALHLAKLLPLWFFITLFKTSSVLHYALLGVFGAKILPLWAVGIATGCTTFLQLILDIPAGSLIDRLGAHKTLRLGSLLFFFSLLPLFFGLSPLTYGLTLFFSAMGWLFFTPSISAYILSVTPAAIMGRTTGARRVAEGLGGMLATIGLASIVTFRVPTIALILCYPIVGAIIIAWFIWKPKKQLLHGAPHHQRANVIRSEWKKLHRVFRDLSPAAPLLTAWSFSTGFLGGVLWVVIALGIAAKFLDIPGYALSTFDGTVLLVSFFLGTLVDKMRTFKVLIFGALALWIVSLFFMSFATKGFFILFAVLLTTYEETITLSLWAWLDEIDNHHDEDGMVSGAVMLAEDLGYTIGPIVASILLAAYGPSFAMLAGGMPALLLFFVFIGWFVRGKKRSLSRG